MKTLYALLFISFIGLSQVNGQLSYKSIAPDFTAEDINGNEHNLYELLDAGKVVVLDVFATWCGPCWTYHNSHVLSDLYNEKGPNGTDEIYVFAIEADSRTNLDCLYGQTDCSYNSIGDWTKDIPYPIMDNTEIGNDYKITYYPTIYMVYPNKHVIEIGQRPEDVLKQFAADAEKPEAGINPIVLYSSNKNGGVCPKNFPSRPNFLISNMGTETVTSMDFELRQNGEIIHESSWTGMAESYQIIADLSLPASIVSENVVYELLMKNINGDANQSTTYYSHLTLKATNLITVKVTTDAAAANDENRYEIKDPNGNVVASGDLSIPNNEYVFTHYLNDKGCYTFRLFDRGSNGIDGEVLVTDSEGNVIYTTKHFGDLSSQDFRVSSLISSDEDLALNAISVSPNPVTSNLFIQSDDISINVQIIDLAGKTLMSYDKIPSNSIDMSQLEAGMYLIKFIKNESIKTQKILKL